MLLELSYVGFANLGKGPICVPASYPKQKIETSNLSPIATLLGLSRSWGIDFLLTCLRQRFSRLLIGHHHNGLCLISIRVVCRSSGTSIGKRFPWPGSWLDITHRASWNLRSCSSFTGYPPKEQAVRIWRCKVRIFLQRRMNKLSSEKSFFVFLFFFSYWRHSFRS